MHGSHPFEIGREFDFYGVDHNRFKLDGTVYEAVEDESDGYRSFLDTVMVSAGPENIFFRSPVDRVVVREVDEPARDGLLFVSIRDGHPWLFVGTINTDDYYPCFRVEYLPRLEVSDAG